MRTFYLIFVGLFLVQIGKSQAIYDMVDPSNQNSSLLYGKTNDSKQVQYLMKYFNTGTIKFSNGTSMINIKINYDPTTDNLITKKFDRDFILEKGLIEKFSFYDPTSSHTYVFVKFKDQKQDFFAEELLVCDSFKVYRKISYQLTVSAPESGYGSDYFKSNNNILKESNYFLLVKGLSIPIERRNDELRAFVSSISQTPDEDLKNLNKLKVNAEDPSKIIDFFQHFCIP